VEREGRRLPEKRSASEIGHEVRHPLTAVRVITPRLAAAFADRKLHSFISC
jgi:hypothetical protein